MQTTQHRSARFLAEVLVVSYMTLTAAAGLFITRHTSYGNEIASSTYKCSIRRHKEALCIK
jgi:hypothetical protein